MLFPEVGISWNSNRTLRSCCRRASSGPCCQRLPHLNKAQQVVSACAALPSGKRSSQSFPSLQAFASRSLTFKAGCGCLNRNAGDIADITERQCRCHSCPGLISMISMNSHESGPGVVPQKLEYRMYKAIIQGVARPGRFTTYQNVK